MTMVPTVSVFIPSKNEIILSKTIQNDYHYPKLNKKTMNVYIETPQDDLALMRINKALIKYAPKYIKIVENKNDSDLVIIHVVGRQDKIYKLVGQLKTQGKSYTVIQHALRRTLRPSTEGWIPLWEGARMVCSFLNLPLLCNEDKQRASFNFYYTPWGVDSEIFKPSSVEKKFIIATSGPDYLTESVREAIHAARAVGKPVFHVGRELNIGPEVICSKGMDDTQLALNYSACEYVSGLRRVEGFELPAAEGLLCGARPIMFDRPHYRAWFNEFAYFIPENSRSEVIESLVTLFKKGPMPVSQDEIEQGRKHFNWATITKSFWDRI